MRSGLLVCGMMILVLGFAASANATVMGSDDLLDGNGDFDTTAQQNAWTFSTYDSDSAAGVTASMYTTPYYGVALFGAGSSGGNYGDYAQAESTFSTVANRAHRVTFDAMLPSTNTSKLYAYVNDDYQNVTASTTYLSRTEATKITWNYTAQAGIGTAVYSVMLRDRLTSSRTSTTGVWVDTVRVYRELAAPEVISITGAGTAWTISNAGGTTAGDELIAFDPDAIITYFSGFDVGNVAVTWNSDNELDLVLDVAPTSNVTLRATNPYGNQTYDFTVVVPEPATLSLLLMGTAGILFRRRKNNL